MLPPHSPLRPVRQRRSRTKRRARPPVAGHACGIARTFRRQGRQRSPKPCSRASMSLLWRPHDRHRNFRRRAPCALAFTEPDQDRHLMSDGAVLTPSQRPSSSTPANRRKRPALSARRPQTLTNRRTHAVPSSRRRRPSPLTSSKLTKSRASGSRTDTRAQPCDRQIPIGRARPDRASSGPRFPPWQAFERRPRGGTTTWTTPFDQGDPKMIPH